MADEITKEEALQYFKDVQFACLGTMDGEQPRIRPMTVIYRENKLWFGTGSESSVTKEIKANNKIELCKMLNVNHEIGSIRLTGTASLIEDKTIADQLRKCCPFFADYWKTRDNAELQLIEIKIEEIKLTKPGEFSARTIKMN